MGTAGDGARPSSEPSGSSRWVGRKERKETQKKRFRQDSQDLQGGKGKEKMARTGARRNGCIVPDPRTLNPGTLAVERGGLGSGKDAKGLKKHFCGVFGARGNAARVIQWERPLPLICLSPVFHQPLVSAAEYSFLELIGIKIMKRPIFVALVLQMIFLMQSAYCDPADAQLDSTICQHLITQTKTCLDNGGNPNQFTALDTGLDAFNGKDPHLAWGEPTPLGRAVAASCVEAVKMLLDGGADPNRYSADTTPLYANYVQLLDARRMEDPAEREAALVPLRQIRDMLISHGAVCDNYPQLQRDFIKKFRVFLASTTNHAIQVLCNGEKLIINAQGEIEQLNVPAGIGDYSVWKAFSGEVMPLLRKHAINANIQILVIGNEEIYLSLLQRIAAMCKREGLVASPFAIPGKLHIGDIQALIQIFLDHPAEYTDEMIQRLNAAFPPTVNNPFSSQEEELKKL